MSTQYSQLRDLRLSILNIWGNEQVDITFQMLLSPWEEAEGWGRGARGFCRGEIRKDHSTELSEREPAASLTHLSLGMFGSKPVPEDKATACQLLPKSLGRAPPEARRLLWRQMMPDPNRASWVCLQAPRSPGPRRGEPDGESQQTTHQAWNPAVLPYEP